MEEVKEPLNDVENNEDPAASKQSHPKKSDFEERIESKKSSK